MKIAFLTESWWPRVNGVTISIDTFREEFDRRGHETYVLASDYGMDPDEITRRNEKRAFRFHGIKPVMSPEDSLISPFESGRMHKILDEIAPDIVHIHTEYFAAVLGLAWARKRGVPAVMSFHTYYEEYAAFYFPWFLQGFARLSVRIFDHFMFNRPDAIVTPSSFMADVLRGYGIRKPVHVIPTGIDPGLFRIEDESRVVVPLPGHETKKIAGKKVLLFVGRVGREKNLDFLLEVFLKIRETNPETILVMGGGGPFLKELKARVAESVLLREHVVFSGCIEYRNMKYLYRLADVFVFPSRTETQGLVTIEAMMSGIPVVAIGERGTLAVMQGDNGGFMVRADAGEFARRVVELLDDPVLCAKKSAEALAWSANWTVSSTADKMLFLYETLIREKAGKKTP